MRHLSSSDRLDSLLPVYGSGRRSCKNEKVIFKHTSHLSLLHHPIYLSYTTPKHVFKRLVKDRVRQAAVEYLQGIQTTKSKAKDLIYESLNLQEYLSSKCKMTIVEKQFTFHARSRMLNLKSNFKQGNSDLSCRACRTDEESQRHILQCSALSNSSILTGENVPEYDDLMSQDSVKIEAIGKILNSKFKAFKNKTNQTNALADATCSASD